MHQARPATARALIEVRNRATSDGVITFRVYPVGGRPAAQEFFSGSFASLGRDRGHRNTVAYIFAGSLEVDNMLGSIRTVPVLSFLLFTTATQQAESQCEIVSVVPRGQHLQIKHSGCPWIRVEYSTTDWSCRGNVCSEKGTVTWHDVKIDTRRKEKVFYLEAARGPKSVSRVVEANVLDCDCG